ncbi:hypothetical protein EYC84_010168 [Monilinia fructicola]|uniref:Uncharacterized protein n=1 Tax=Monilinia fructicola TaxID=38448 RepID=A0A5M9JGK3_MONFR|nr:hypothetical protein EYC84_010168 [Monilinia fructicola]
MGVPTRHICGEGDGERADARRDVGQTLQEADPGVELGERLLVAEGIAEGVSEGGERDDTPEVLGGVEVELRDGVDVCGTDFVEPVGEGDGVGDGA